ncbi:MAG: hypothetical protein JRM72_01165 [Nitrososphaerota archaeon]|nr:hypothetical protein [Nitrososphaerota archaeon]
MKKIGARLTEVTVLSPEGILSDPGGAEIDKIVIDTKMLKINSHNGHMTLDGKYLLLLLNAGLLTYTNEVTMRDILLQPRAATNAAVAGMFTVLKILYTLISRIDSGPVVIIDKKQQIALIIEQVKGRGLKAVIRTKYDSFILDDGKSGPVNWFFLVDLVDPASLRIEPMHIFLKETVEVINEETQEIHKIPMAAAIRAVRNNIPVDAAIALN